MSWRARAGMDVRWTQRDGSFTRDTTHVSTCIRVCVSSNKLRLVYDHVMRACDAHILSSLYLTICYLVLMNLL